MCKASKETELLIWFVLYTLCKCNCHLWTGTSCYTELSIDRSMYCLHSSNTKNAAGQKTMLFTRDKSPWWHEYCK